MQSLVLDFERRKLVEREVAEPILASPTEVRIQIHEVGVCGTDRELANFRMRPRERDAKQIAIGHEALGRIVETGVAVTGFSRGDWVVPTIRRGCIRCSSCGSGRSDLCLSGAYSERGIFNLDGYYTEFAIDEAEYLVRVPEEMVPYAVLVEPMSVVEKCVERIETLRQSDGRRAMVLGLGPIGLLSGMLLRLRGYDVQVVSQEPEDHPRLAIVREIGAEYSRTLDGKWDVIVEAAGSAALALEAIKRLGPCGVFITLGAQRAQGELSFIDLIVGNQTVAGIVNASRRYFEQAAEDLARIPESALKPMIRRFGYFDYRETLFEPSAQEPKFVHVIANSLH